MFYLLFYWFWVDLEAWDEGRSTLWIELSPRRRATSCYFGLSVFWLICWWIFGGCWPHAGHQDPVKSIWNPSKNHFKKYQFVDRFYVDLCWILLDLGSQQWGGQGGYCWILGPSMGGSRGYSNALFELMLDLGAKMGQDSPKSPPRGPQEPSKSCPRASKSPPREPWGHIFGRLLIDFLKIFW